MAVRVVALALLLVGFGVGVLPSPASADCHHYYPPCYRADRACDNVGAAATWSNSAGNNQPFNADHPCFLWNVGDTVVIGGAELLPSTAASGVRLGQAWFALQTDVDSGSLSLAFKAAVPDYTSLHQVGADCATFVQVKVVSGMTISCQQWQVTPLRAEHIHIPYQVFDDAREVVDEGLFLVTLPVSVPDPTGPIRDFNVVSFGAGLVLGGAVAAVAVWFVLRRGR